MRRRCRFGEPTTRCVPPKLKRTVNTRIALATTKKGDLPIADYFAKMKSFGDEMLSAGKPLDDEELVSYISLRDWAASTTQWPLPSWLDQIRSASPNSLLSSSTTTNARRSARMMVLTRTPSCTQCHVGAILVAARLVMHPPARRVAIAAIVVAPLVPHLSTSYQLPYPMSTSRSRAPLELSCTLSYGLKIMRSPSTLVSAYSDAD